MSFGSCRQKPLATFGICWVRDCARSGDISGEQNPSRLAVLQGQKRQSRSSRERLRERVDWLLLAIISLLQSSEVNGDGRLHLPQLGGANGVAMVQHRGELAVSVP